MRGASCETCLHVRQLIRMIVCLDSCSRCSACSPVGWVSGGEYGDMW